MAEADDDKYPTESGRRRFVKGVVASAALAGVGTATGATLESATSAAGAGGGITKFFGIENTDGPAPRAMPQIPVTIDGEGFVKGIWPDEIDEEENVAVTTIGGTEYKSSWFQYCGVQTLPGVVPDADLDNFFRSANSPPYDWQQEAAESGDKLHVDDFADYEEWGNGIGRSGLGKPAMANWRSTDVSPQETIVVQVMRSKKIQEMRQNPPAGSDPEWLRASTTESGFIAWLDKCTHFCCVPSFKGIAGSAKFGGEDGVYCPCHQSVYDPFSLVKRTFVALPRPNE